MLPVGKELEPVTDTLDSSRCSKGGCAERSCAKPEGSTSYTASSLSLSECHLLCMRHNDDTAADDNFKCNYIAHSATTCTLFAECKEMYASSGVVVYNFVGRQRVVAGRWYELEVRRDDGVFVVGKTTPTPRHYTAILIPTCAHTAHARRCPSLVP